MNRPRRSTPEPLDVDVVSVVAVGTVVWFVAFVVMLPLRGRLADAGHGDWFWTALAGWVLGLMGIVVARAQRAARARAAQAAHRASADHGERAEHTEGTDHTEQAEGAERADPDAPAGGSTGGSGHEHGGDRASDRHGRGHTG